MAPPKQAPSAPQIAHFETYTPVESGQRIRVICACIIGHDHTFKDWVDAGSPATTALTGTRAIDSAAMGSHRSYSGHHDEG